MKSVRILRGKINYLLLLSLTIFSLASCSTDPSSSDGKGILGEKISEESKGKIKLISFEKTNAIKKSMFGQEQYTLEYSATIEFQQEGWVGENFNNFQIRDKKSEGWDEYFLSISNGNSKHFNIGDKVKLTGKMTFEKTEKGWRPTSLIVYSNR